MEFRCPKWCTDTTGAGPITVRWGWKPGSLQTSLIPSQWWWGWGYSWGPLVHPTSRKSRLPLSLWWCGWEWSHHFYLWFLAGLSWLKVLTLVRLPLSCYFNLCWGLFVCLFAPFDISRMPASSAPGLGTMRLKENTGNSSPDCASDPKVPSLSAFFSPSFRFPLMSYI